MKTIGILIADITQGHGTERAVTNLSNILIDSGYTIYIFSSNSTDGGGYFELNKLVKVIHLGINFRNYRGLRKFVPYKLLYKQLLKYRDQLAIDCFIGTYFTFNIILPFVKKVRTIGCEHFNYNHANSIQKIIRRIFYKKLNKLVVLTESDAKHYKFINKNNLSVIPNSASFSDNGILPKYSSKNFIAVGRLCYQKGFDMLIDSCNLLQKKSTNWKLRIVGEGEDYKLLEERIKEYKLQNNITIIQPQKNIIALYKDSCAYVMTSRFEGLPMVLIEAQTCGLPIISFDCPEGPADVVKDGRNGLLIDKNNIVDFADAMYNLVTNSELCKKYGVAAYEDSHRFSTEYIKSRWLEILI